MEPTPPQNLLLEPKHHHFVVIFCLFAFVVLIILAYIFYLNRDLIFSERNIPLMDKRVHLTEEQRVEKRKLLENTDTSQKTLSKDEAQEKLFKILEIKQSK